MAEKSNADLGNGEVTESPPVTTANYISPSPCRNNPVKLILNRFLPKIVGNEIMYELRKMKHEKPVTKTKENTKKLLEKLALHKDARVARSAGKKKRKLAKKFEQSAAELTQLDSDSFKPEEVLQEVRGLLEQQRVTEFLQNEIERQHLEQLLMETIERRQNEQQRRSQRRQVRFANNESVAAASGSTFSRNSVPSHDHEGRQQHYRMPRRDQAQIISQLRASPALNRMDPEQRDEVISEISNLVQRKLVTTTLSGELRGVLELHIQERADRVSSGQGVDSVMQSLQRRNTYHREAHHGRDSQQDQETYSGLRSDIEQIKNQLRDMKQMMRISFDLQMDIQRAIRQEVAAAMVAACNMQTAHIQTVGFTPPPSSVNTGPIAGQPTPPISSGQCIICLQRQIDSVIYRCGHMCVCITCGLELKGQNLKCPVCRAPITDIIRAYTSC